MLLCSRRCRGGGARPGVGPFSKQGNIDLFWIDLPRLVLLHFSCTSTVWSWRGGTRLLGRWGPQRTQSKNKLEKETCLPLCRWYIKTWLVCRHCLGRRSPFHCQLTNIHESNRPTTHSLHSNCTNWSCLNWWHSSWTKWNGRRTSSWRRTWDRVGPWLRCGPSQIVSLR